MSWHSPCTRGTHHAPVCCLVLRLPDGLSAYSCARHTRRISNISWRLQVAWSGKCLCVVQQWRGVGRRVGIDVRWLAVWRLCDTLGGCVHTRYGRTYLCMAHACDALHRSRRRTDHADVRYGQWKYDHLSRNMTRNKRVYDWNFFPEIRSRGRERLINPEIPGSSADYSLSEG